MKQFLHNHGLFAALLTASLVGHVSVKWLGPVVSLDPQMAQVESGRNSVSIQLIAVMPQTPDAAEIELPDLLPPDRSHLRETPEPEREVEIEEPQRSMADDVAVVTADASSPLETAASEISPPPLLRHPRPSPQSPRPEQTSGEFARQHRNREIEVANADIEIPQTVLSEQSAGEEVPPSFVSRPLPAYPANLLLQRIEGTVELLVTVGVDGRVLDVALHRSSGYAAMDRSALSTIRRWTFRPARRGDTPIAKRAIVPIGFTIQE